MLIERFGAWLFSSRDFAPDELIMQGTARSVPPMFNRQLSASTDSVKVSKFTWSCVQSLLRSRNHDFSSYDQLRGHV